MIDEPDDAHSRADMRALEALSPFRVDGKVACVTGGGSGIGRAIAELLSSVGASVVVGDLDFKSAERVAETIDKAGGRAIPYAVDVSKRDQVESFVDQAIETYERLDFMCNIAGIPAGDPCNLSELEETDYQRVMAVNLEGVLYGCQAASSRIASSGGGAILNASSTSIDTAGMKGGFGLYELSKTGVVSLTRTFAFELASANIRVNALAPGVTVSNFVARHFSDDHGNIDEAARDEWVAKASKNSPLGIVGAPEDQAWLALYLLSDAGRFVTGQVIRANGGWTMR